jgi:signal transduction histidine kinase
LVQTFLMLARAQSNEGVSTKTSLVRVADDVTALWRVPVERKGLQLIYERIDVDETHYSSTFLHAVMGNLLRNALHHTERGSIRLEVRTRSFVVEDVGASVVESQRDLQLSQANVLPIERVGLGLSLVQRICADQGWHITLTPLAPRGCRFQVDLDPAFRT